MAQLRNLMIILAAFRRGMLTTVRFREVARVLIDEPAADIRDLLESSVNTQMLKEMISLVDAKLAESDGQTPTALAAFVDEEVSSSSPEFRSAAREVVDEFRSRASSGASGGKGTSESTSESRNVALNATFITAQEAGPFNQTVHYAPDESSAEADAAANEETIQRKKEVATQGTRTRYLLTRVEGAGGLGQVWLARDPLLRREVALKENIPGKGTAEGSKRLVREAQITGVLEHPNIIPVYELGHRPEDGEPFYTMRFVKDETLARYIKRFHKQRKSGDVDWMALRQLLDSFVGVCNAMAYAHDNGVMHRDLKPSNVMMGDFGEVIVLDWGLASFLGEQESDVDLNGVEAVDPDHQLKTMDGQIIGTPAYMAPEQANGERSRMGIATDIYGLGGILFAILTGEAPNNRRRDGSTHRGTAAMLMCISSGEIAQARDLEHWIPKPLNAICSKALALRPEDRYPTAAKLADDVRRWMADEPVSCFDEPFSVTVLRWLRRHRTWAKAISVSLILIATVSTVAGIWIEAARRDEAAARAAANDAYLAEHDARETADAARQEALEHFQNARDAVDKSLTGFSSVLEYFPAAESVREKLLEEAAADYERFASEQSDVPEIRAEAGNAWSRLGDVRITLKQAERAATAYSRAIATFESLCDEFPENEEYTIRLAVSCGRLSALNDSRGEDDDATRLFDRAEALLTPLIDGDNPPLLARDALAALLLNRARMAERLRDEDGARILMKRASQQLDALIAERDLDEYRFRRASAHHVAGTIELQFGNFKAAVAAFEESRTEFSNLSLKHRDDPRYFEGLAGSKVAMANALSELGQQEEAFAQNESAIEDYELLSEARPGIPDYQRNAAITEINIAQILFTDGASLDARPYGMKALEELTALLSRFPNEESYLNAHATCSSALGMILRDLNEDESALQLFDNAITLFGRLATEVPAVPEFRRRLGISLSSLGRTLHKLGRHEEAAEAFGNAQQVFEQSLISDETDEDTRNALAWVTFHLGMLLHETGEMDAATRQFAASFAEWSRLVKESASTDRLYNFAFLLLHCPISEFHDGETAVERCIEATEAAPRNPRYWNLRALAALRTDDATECVRCVTVAESFRLRENAADSFLRGLAESHRGNAKAASEHLEKGIAIMDTQQPGNVELIRLRQELEALVDPSTGN